MIAAPQASWPNCSPDRFREICGELAAIYASIHAGKRIVWRDQDNEHWKDITCGPTVACIVSGRKFAIYPDEPQFVWAIRSASNPAFFIYSEEESVAKHWRDDGLTVHCYEQHSTSFRTP